jgi:hypothetical protein
MHPGWRSASLSAILAVLITACSPGAPAAGDPSSASDPVGTIVAMTLQAVAPAAEATPASSPGVSGDVLPHTLYFLTQDDQGLRQIHRMERDGKTVAQLTNEPFEVSDYDVLPLDGSLAYEVNGQLILVQADGSNRRLLVEGAPGPESGRLYHPTFSPDGRTLAYSQDGLNLYDIAAGASQLVLQDQYGEALPDGARLILEGYWPEEYSPDGSQLLVALGHWEVAPSHAVYEPATRTLVRYAEDPDLLQRDVFCCSFHGGPAWSPDGASYYGIASAHDFAYQSGELWRVEARSGAVTRLITTSDGMLNLPKEIFPAPDGRLYYFFGTYSQDLGYFDAPLLQLVRSESDGVTGRTVLRQENFVLMKEALWAPDASFVVVASAPDQNWRQAGGVLELYYTDGQRGSVWLAPFGEKLKWGP